MREVKAALQEAHKKGMLTHAGQFTLGIDIVPKKEYASFVFHTNDFFPARNMQPFTRILIAHGFQKVNPSEQGLADQNLNEGTPIYSSDAESVYAHKRIYYNTLKNNRDFKDVDTLLDLMKQTKDKDVQSELSLRIFKRLLDLH